MRIIFDEVGTVESLQKNLRDLGATAKTMMVLGCIDNNYNVDEMDMMLEKCDFKVYGALFPKVIYEDTTYDKGAIIVGFPYEQEVRVLNDLSDDSIDFTERIEDAFPAEKAAETMFVFVDGFAKRINSLIDSLFEVFGLEQNYIGGGAGSLDFIQRECLFTNKGFVQDAAILVQTNRKSSIGVKHGWNSIAGPFSVTSSEKNVIKELDYKPAFEVYKKVVQNHCNCEINKENFFDIAKAYPFGINKLETEKIVRDPIVVENNYLVCVGDVAQNEYVDILNGTDKTLIDAAKSSYENAIANKKGDADFILFIDCISRVLFLEDDFEKEINAVKNSSLPLIGALTLGEIANSGSDYLEFYNKTAVVGIM